MAEPKQLLSELLRPQQLGDLTLPQRDIDRFQRMVKSGFVMNMIFHGAPGLGKTSAAQFFINALGPETSFEINGSSATGVEFVRNEIESYAKAGSLFVGINIIFIDEADYVSKNAQGALRKVIEDYSDNCRFLLAVNDISKVIPALRSRLMEVCFDIAPADRHEVKARLLERYERSLSELGAAFDQKRLIELIAIYYPDLRSIANHVEYEFAL